MHETMVENFNSAEWQMYREPPDKIPPAFTTATGLWKMYVLNGAVLFSLFVAGSWYTNTLR